MSVTHLSPTTTVGHPRRVLAWIRPLVLALTLAVLGSMAVPAQANAASDPFTSIVNLAESRVGKTPYVFGGESLVTGADCSGFTQTVFGRYGLTLPRTAAKQAAAVPPITAAQARPGDLVFFHDSTGLVFHVGIYVGSGRIVDASGSQGWVVERPIWSSRVTYGSLR